ncbi:MAG TPA: hypothetical protein VMJ72_00615 [Candidatus Paceibacterota bacterium]|nr:hypothetical protein [Candidatus Paceibacterota bacterium]
MTDIGPYEPVKLKACPRCGGSGTVTVHKRGSPYEPPGLLMCPGCKGAGRVLDRTDPDDAE